MRAAKQIPHGQAIIEYFCDIVSFKVFITENILIPLCSRVHKCQCFVQIVFFCGNFYQNWYKIEMNPCKIKDSIHRQTTHTLCIDIDVTDKSPFFIRLYHVKEEDKIF